MIVHFLKSCTSKSHGLLVGSIISSNIDFMLDRLKTLEKFIINEFDKLIELNKSTEIPSTIEKLSPCI